MHHWFFPRWKWRKPIISYLRLINSTGKNYNIEVNRILFIAKRIGFNQDEINKIIHESNQGHVGLSPDSDKKFILIYDFIKFIFETQDNGDELDLCIAMAMIIGYERHEAPAVATEIYNGLITGTDETTIKNKIMSLPAKLCSNVRKV